MAAEILTGASNWIHGPFSFEKCHIKVLALFLSGVSIVSFLSHRIFKKNIYILSVLSHLFSIESKALEVEGISLLSLPATLQSRLPGESCGMSVDEWAGGGLFKKGRVSKQSRA